MKKRFLGLAMGLAVAAAGLVFAAGQNPVLDFKLVNKTGVDVYAVYISPSEVNDWEEDILDVDVLEDGESVDIEFHPKETAKLWDLMVQDEDETAIVWENLDLSKVNVLTLKIVDGKPVAEIK